MLSRRVFLLAGAGASFASDPSKSPVYRSDAKRYNDPLTEFAVVRLTSPEYTSRLTAYHNRGIAAKTFLYFCCDREGKMDVYRADLRSGETKRLTDGERVQPSTLDLLPGDRSLMYADGRSLRLLSTSNLKRRELYSASGDILAASVSEDGTHAAVVETADRRNRLTLIPIGNGEPRRLAETDEALGEPIHRLLRASILYRRGPESLFLANYDGVQNYKLRLAAENISTPQWSPDGRTIFYLSIASNPSQKNEIREFTPDTNEDKPVAPTTRFVQFRANADASVFAGASGSKASPHVLLLLRSVKRELTICEHRASDPRMVSPVFSPNSQRVFFVSDQHGKPAVYSVGVDRLIDET